ncbi:MAG: UPF0262 family protein [Alphaproteobacteria bacterium]
MSANEYIAKLSLDDEGVRRRSPEAEHERTIAMTDLKHRNKFHAHCLECGPYDVKLGVRENRLVFAIHAMESERKADLVIPVLPLKQTIKDYFLICESYYEALKQSGHARLESIDMARRGIHNEGADMLQNMLKGRVTVDSDTARRLFTLICVLHIK